MSDQVTESEQTQTGWRHKTLKAAGASYIVGDTAGAIASALRPSAGGQGSSKWKTAAGFGVWGVGGAAAAFFGNPDTDKQLEILAHKLRQHLAQNGITIPSSAAAQSELLQDQGLLHNVSRFLYEHPSEVLNTAYAIGAGMMVHGGWKAIQQKERTLFPSSFKLDELNKVSTDFWSGLLVSLGALGGLFIKEDPHAQEKAKDGGVIDKTKAYFSEKALRFPGMMYGLNNIVLAGRVMQEHRDYKNNGKTFKPYHFSAVTLATYIFSNLMLQFSPRNQIAKHLPAEAVAKLEQAAAAIIAAQPPEMQQAVLADVSAYMASQKGVTFKAPEIASHLASRVTELTAGRMQAAATQVKWTDKLAQEMPASQARS